MQVTKAQERRRARREADVKRRAEQPWRVFYKRREWKALRSLVLAEEPLCRMCANQGKVTPADVVDHVKPHKGDASLFFDYQNLQPLCKWHHDSVKQTIERLGYSKEVGTDGWPLDPKHPTNQEPYANELRQWASVTMPED